MFILIKILGFLLAGMGLIMVFINPLLGIIIIIFGIYLILYKKTDSKIQEIQIKNPDKKRAYRRFKVAGVTFEGRQQLLHGIEQQYGSKGSNMITFVPEPDNEYDPNAIKIMFEGVGLIGYVPKKRAVDIKRLLDRRNYDVGWRIGHFDDDFETITSMTIRLY